MSRATPLSLSSKTKVAANWEGPGGGRTEALQRVVWTLANDCTGPNQVGNEVEAEAASQEAGGMPLPGGAWAGSSETIQKKPALVASRRPSSLLLFTKPSWQADSR